MNGENLLLKRVVNGGLLVRVGALVLACATGCQEAGVTKFNNNPEANI